MFRVSLAFGIVSALWERERSGLGQVVDAAIVDGVASLMTMFGGLIPSGTITLEPDRNLLGGQAPFYRCYECSDGKYVSVGPLEPAFWAELLQKIGASDDLRKRQNDASNWAERGKLLEQIFVIKTQEEWSELLAGTDACFAPVLTYEESLSHPQMIERETYIEIDGLRQAAPSPRFSRTPGDVGLQGDGQALLARWKTSKMQKAN